MCEFPDVKQAENILREKSLDATIKDHLNYMIAAGVKEVQADHMFKGVKLTIRYKIRFPKKISKRETARTGGHPAAEPSHENKNKFR